MTRIDFYILPIEDDASRWHFTCRLAEKAWRQGNLILLHTANSAMSQHLDALLWSFRADSFLPHDALPTAHQSPVHIGHGDYGGNHHDLLINLGDTIPGFFSRFDRVAEIVTQQPSQITANRERFRFYRERGYEIKINDMKK
jgi:DNA polymerase-3 subunit chi